MQSLALVTFMVSEKVTLLKFLTCWTRSCPASLPDTDLYNNTIFFFFVFFLSCESHCLQKWVGVGELGELEVHHFLFLFSVTIFSSTFSNLAVALILVVCADLLLLNIFSACKSFCLFFFLTSNRLKHQLTEKLTLVLTDA